MGAFVAVPDKPSLKRNEHTSSSRNKRRLSTKRAIAVATLSKKLAETDASFQAATRTLACERIEHVAFLQSNRKDICNHDIELRYAQSAMRAATRGARDALRLTLVTKDRLARIDAARCGACWRLDHSTKTADAAHRALSRVLLSERTQHKIHSDAQASEIMDLRRRLGDATRDRKESRRSTSLVKDRLVRIDAALLGAHRCCDRAMADSANKSICVARNSLFATRASARARSAISSCERLQSENSELRARLKTAAECKEKRTLLIENEKIKSQARNIEAKTREREMDRITQALTLLAAPCLACAKSRDTDSMNRIKIDGLCVSNKTLAAELSIQKQDALSHAHTLRLVLQRANDTDFTRKIVNTVCGDGLPNHAMIRNYRFACKIMKLFYREAPIPPLGGTAGDRRIAAKGGERGGGGETRYTVCDSESRSESTIPGREESGQWFGWLSPDRPLD